MMNVTVLRNDVQVYGREQAFGGNQLTLDVARLYGMSVEEAETAKRSHSLPENYTADLLRPFMDNLSLEISRALQFFFTSTQYNQVDHIVLSGVCSHHGLGGCREGAHPDRHGDGEPVLRDDPLLEGATQGAAG